MSAADERNTQPDAARRAMIADMQARLAEFGRLLAQIRAGLPEQHAQALSRIEQGMGSLAERIGALGREGQRGWCVAPPPLPVLSPSEDEPWDRQSAEELMRIYEAMDDEPARAGPQAHAHRCPQWRSDDLAGAKASEPPPHDAAWLEARFAAIAALVERALTDARPAKVLADLDRRLDQFERRLDRALGDMASGGRGDLKLIDAHLVEFAGHVEAVREQLARLDAMDAQLRELARALERAEKPRASHGPWHEDAVAELINSAAERAASKVAASLPAAGGGQDRVNALEVLVGDCVAEHRRSEEASAGVLHSIEAALLRIVDRLEAMEAMMAAPAPADSVPPEPDGLEVEHDRLAEAYAEGARVLGQQVLEPTLDAADYVAADRQLQRERLRDAAVQLGVDDPAAPDEQEGKAREGLRAKLTDLAHTQERGLEHADPDGSEANRLGQGRAPTWASAKAGRHWAGLLLGGAMALLFGAGFMAVDSFLAKSTPAPAQRQPVPQPGGGKADVAPQINGASSEAAPVTQPAPRPAAPDANGQDPSQVQPAPTRRLDRLQTGTAAAASFGATPVMLPPPDRGGVAPAPAAGTGTPANATAPLPQTPATGDAEAAFEIAARFADGRGVPQDQKQAFIWYERAAARGLAAAQFRLAVYFERGVGVAADRERAKVWYGRAAEQGHVRAMHNLGVLAATDERQADYATAAFWFGQAAERGLADSQFNLAMLYESGRGVAKDLQEAYKWFALAARNGDPLAARRLEQVAGQLQASEVDAAEQKLAVWRPIATQAATGSIGSGDGR
jgi:localization factor PodJL